MHQQQIGRSMSNTLKHQTKDGGTLSSPTHSGLGKCPCYSTTSRASAALCGPVQMSTSFTHTYIHTHYISMTNTTSIPLVLGLSWLENAFSHPTENTHSRAFVP